MTILHRKEKTPLFWCGTARNNTTKGVPNKLTWLLYQDTSSLRIPKKVFFVRSAEQNPCPCCNGRLEVIGSRRRKCINSAGDKIVLILRRLQCSNCERVHHELPDILVPYKRHCSESIEAVISGNTQSVAADESTMTRWRFWFYDLINHFLGCLISIAVQYCRNSVEVPSCLSKSPLQRIWHYVGDSCGWLARVVRTVTNSNNWIQTRSAFLS